MISLVYVSQSSRPMTTEELLEILAVSYQNNLEYNITGRLLYKDGNFLQVMEGESESVIGHYENIKRDERHHGVYVISHRCIVKRHFHDWKMSFPVTHDLSDLCAYSDFLSSTQSTFEFFRGNVIAHRFLQVFKLRTS